MVLEYVWNPIGCLGGEMLMETVRGEELLDLIIDKSEQVEEAYQIKVIQYPKDPSQV